MRAVPREADIHNGTCYFGLPIPCFKTNVDRPGGLVTHPAEPPALLTTQAAEAPNWLTPSSGARISPYFTRYLARPRSTEYPCWPLFPFGASWPRLGLAPVPRIPTFICDSSGPHWTGPAAVPRYRFPTLLLAGAAAPLSCVASPPVPQHQRFGLALGAFRIPLRKTWAANARSSPEPSEARPTRPRMSACLLVQAAAAATLRAAQAGSSSSYSVLVLRAPSRPLK